MGGGLVDPPAVAAVGGGWGVTRRTSVSDMSEQLAGRCGGVGSGLRLPPPSPPPQGRALRQQITDEEAGPAAESFAGSHFTPLRCARITSCASLHLSHVFKLTGFSSQAASVNVTLRREVMKWSNYGSICAIQMKPGVKFPICAPAVRSAQRALTRVLPVSR